MSYLKTRRDLLSLRRRSARRLENFINQILKIHPAAFEAGGLHVCQVVRNYIECELLGEEDFSSLYHHSDSRGMFLADVAGRAIDQRGVGPHHPLDVRAAGG